MGQNDIIKIRWKGVYYLLWRPISCVKNIFCLQLTMCFYKSQAGLRLKLCLFIT
jgi:hypothetical protein